jgi:hypothetical protein
VPELFAGPICEGWGCTPLYVLFLAPFAVAFALIVGVYAALIIGFKNIQVPRLKKACLVGLFLFTAMLLGIGGYWYWYEATTISREIRGKIRVAQMNGHSTAYQLTYLPKGLKPDMAFYYGSHLTISYESDQGSVDIDTIYDHKDYPISRERIAAPCKLRLGTREKGEPCRPDFAAAEFQVYIGNTREGVTSYWLVDSQQRITARLLTSLNDRAEIVKMIEGLQSK